MDNQINETIVKGRKIKRLVIDPETKNWPRISINNFGIKYNLDFPPVKHKRNESENDEK